MVANNYKKMKNKIIFTLLFIYLFIDIIKLYSKGDYLWIKIVLFILMIIIWAYYKIFK